MEGDGSAYARAGRQWTYVLLAAVALPIFAAGLTDPEINQATEFARISAVVAYVAFFIADILIYLHWRMTGGPANWLVLALTALTTQSLVVAGFVAANPSEAVSRPGLIVLTRLMITIGLFVLVARSRRSQLRIDPLLWGVIAGVVVQVVRELFARFTEPMQWSQTALHVLNAGYLLLDVAIVVALIQLTIAAHWVRVRLGCAFAFLVVGHNLAYPTPDGVLLSIVVISTNVIGATLMLSLAVTLVGRSLSDNRTAMDLLGSRLELVEAGARVEQARLHEIRATIAGIGCASRLIHQNSAVSEVRRRHIEEMMDSEMARLQRLLADDASGSPVIVDLDKTIEPIVTRIRARGYPIRWDPNGHQALARADDVAEIVSVLLENAVRHAPGASASIVTLQGGGAVEIAISDSGPGIDVPMRSKLFEWGTRGHASIGSGIGLNVARQLSADLGGYLKLVDSAAPGATFVLGLPTEEM